MHFMIDCDDVLLDWQQGFRSHLFNRHAIRAPAEGPSSWSLAEWLGISEQRCLDLITEFNASQQFGELAPMPGAFSAVQRLARQGYRLTVLTSCSDDPVIVDRRKENLRRVFGGAFDRIICVGLLESKRTWLDVLRPGIWIEDNYRNALMGKDAGNKTFVMRRSHNRADEATSDPHLIWCDDWQPIISHFS